MDHWCQQSLLIKVTLYIFPNTLQFAFPFVNQHKCKTFPAVNAGASSKPDKKRVGRIVGIALGCVAGFVIILSMFYLWFTKKGAPGHMRVYTDSPRKKGLR